MKHTMTKGWAVAALATLLAACSTDDTADRTPAPGKIEVAFRTAMPESRAQISVDETAGRFTGAWEETDVMTVYANGETAPFTYTADGKVFTGQLTDATQDWTYQALYPHVEGAEGKVPFGAVRTQKGDKFNSAYDPLVSKSVSHAASAPGKTPGGDPVTFELSRLTSILALTFTVSDAEIAAEKVKSVKLTADGGEIIAAETFDIDRSAESGALAAAGRSSTIALIYEAGSEPAAASFKAYFNIPAGEYGKLTAEVATEGHTARIDLTSGVVLAAGELAYATYAIADADWTAPAAAPTMEWVGHTPDADGTYEPEKIEKGMNVVINLQAAAGIEEFVIKIDSKALTSILNEISGGTIPYEGTVTTMDLINNEAAMGILSTFLTFPSPLKGYKESFSLDLSEFVPLILKLPNMSENIKEEDIYGDHVFTLSMTDALGRSIERMLTFFVPEPEATPAIVYNGDANAWTNTATFTVSDIPENATDVKVQYRIKGTDDWKNAIQDENTEGKWTIAATWNAPADNGNGYQVYTVDNTTGIFANHAYEYRLVYTVGTETKSITGGEISAINGDTIEDLNNSTLSCYGIKNTSASFWGSGNNALRDKLCDLQNTYATLTASTFNSKLIPGNLFTGTFSVNISFTNMAGTVNFGQDYTYTARPTALKFDYTLSFGTTLYNAWNGPLTEGHDYASIIVCIVNWDERHGVTSSMGNAPTGTWDPADPNAEGNGLTDAQKKGIIAYGAWYPNEDKTTSTEGYIPLYYYDKDAGIPTGNYKIIISCATSRYGDYLNGTENTLAVKNFEWVY